MKSVARSLIVVLVAMIAVPALVVSATITTAVQLLATTALILGGTGHSLGSDDTQSYIPGYLDWATNAFIKPGYSPQPAPTDINQVAVIYPAQFFPVSGTTTFDDSVAAGRDNLSHCLGASVGGCNYNTSLNSAPPNPATDNFIVFGYSQGAVVASLVKNQLVDTGNTSLDGTRFYLISNPMRPNGGILARGFQGTTIPILGITFYGPTENSCGGATCDPSDPTVYPTVDVAQQYDFLGGDAPSRLDPIAFANSLAAYALLHGAMQNKSLNEQNPLVVNQGTYGDTTYYLVTAPRLPLLMLAEQAGVPDAALALPDALLRVWIEDKYSRDVSPGQHVQFQLIPVGNPVALVGNMLGAVPVGIDDTVQEASGTNLRPLGTANVYRPFGVGGPVYDKTTGAQATDNVGIPTGSGSYPTQAPAQTLTQQPTVGTTDPQAKNNVDTTTVTNATEEPQTPAPATKPTGPLQIVRDSMNFDPTKKPSATRPSGDGPLKKIVSALTGQRPTSTTDSSSDSSGSKASSPAA